MFGITKGETTYSLHLFPIGGACMMEGEDTESEEMCIRDRMWMFRVCSMPRKETKHHEESSVKVKW